MPTDIVPLKQTKSPLIAWCLFEIGPVLVAMAFPIIFGPYFITHMAVNNIIGTHEWGNAVALAALISCLSPIVGAFADCSGRHKYWLFFFNSLFIICIALLWFAYPNPHYVNFSLSCVVIGALGLEITIVFYNAFLPQVALPNYFGRVSGWSMGLGIIVSAVILLILLFTLIKHPPIWLDVNSAEHIRICGPIIAFLIVIFSLPFFMFVPDRPSTKRNFKQILTGGLNELKSTIKSLPSQKNITLYLIAHLFYTDGLTTLSAFSGIYLAGIFKMSLSEIIIFGIVSNTASGVGAIIFSWLSDWIGSKLTVLIFLIFSIILGIPLLITHNIITFWILAIMLSLILGSVVSTSRSLMANIIDLSKTTEMFGLYSLSGRVTAFLGPWTLGLVTFYFNSQRAGMATIIVFLIIGTIFLYFVRDNKARESEVIA